jgi:hypothetical protein
MTLSGGLSGKAVSGEDASHLPLTANAQGTSIATMVDMGNPDA